MMMDLDRRMGAAAAGAGGGDAVGVGLMGRGGSGMTGGGSIDGVGAGGVHQPMRGRYGAIIPPSLPGAGPGSNTKIHSNDYCQHFVDSGQRPQNFLRDSHLTDRYELKIPHFAKVWCEIQRWSGHVGQGCRCDGGHVGLYLGDPQNVEG